MDSPFFNDSWLMNPDISILTASLSNWELIGYFSVAAVIIAVLGEFIHEFTGWFHTWTWWKINGGKASVLFLIFALCAELLVHTEENRINGQITSSLNNQVVEAKAPRTLTPERQQIITNALMQFKGQKYKVAISQAADDGIEFWNSLYASLNEAGWAYLQASPPSIGNPPAFIPITAMPGVEIRFDPSEETKLAPAALALGNALHTNKIAVAVNRNTQDNPNKEELDVLMIVIGARVPPS